MPNKCIENLRALTIQPKNGSWRTVKRSTLVRRGSYVEGDCHLNRETAVTSCSWDLNCPVREFRDGGAILLKVSRKQNIFTELQPRPGFRRPPTP